MAEIGRIELRDDGDSPTVAMVGEFDLSNAPMLVQCFDELAAAGHSRAVLDVSATSFIDSTVLGALSLAYRHGLLLDIRGAHGQVRRELERSGLSAIFDIS